MMNSFHKLPDLYQGILYVVAGTVALLYAMGIIQKGITTAIIIISLLVILTGLMKIGLFRKLHHGER